MEGRLNFEKKYVGGKLSERQRSILYEERVKCVVSIELYSRERKEYDCEGVGVFVSSEGHILTLSHILNDDEHAQVQVATSVGERYLVSILSMNTSLGLALLKADPSMSNPATSTLKAEFPYATISQKTDFVIGAEVYPIGHPGYLDFSYPVGHVSFPCREYQAVHDSLVELKRLKNARLKQLRRYGGSENTSFKDESEKFICYVQDLNKLKLSGSVPLVQVNNVHGDSLEGSSGTPLFSRQGSIKALYLFQAQDQVYGIHAKALRDFYSSCVEEKKE